MNKDILAPKDGNRNGLVGWQSRVTWKYFENLYSYFNFLPFSNNYLVKREGSYFMEFSNWQILFMPIVTDSLSVCYHSCMT